MLGKDGRFYDPCFDFNGDGELDLFELSVLEDVVFGEDKTTEDEEDELFDPELDLDGWEDMDDDERREALEDAGFDPDDYDDVW